MEPNFARQSAPIKLASSCATPLSTATIMPPLTIASSPTTTSEPMAMPPLGFVTVALGPLQLKLLLGALQAALGDRHRVIGRRSTTQDLVHLDLILLQPVAE